jgi:putative transposase
MSQPHRKTRKTFNTPGDSHFLTFSTFNRLPLLTKKRSCQWVVDAIALSRERNPFDLWAWVVMPEHIHLVLFPHEGTKISSILKTLKQSVSKRAIIWLKENAPDYLSVMEDVQPNGKSSYRFWQRGGGYDRNLRSVRDIHEKIFYVHQNPVARGLALRPEDYHLSSAQAWKTGVDEPLVVDRDSVPALTDDSLNSKLMH